MFDRVVRSLKFPSLVPMLVVLGLAPFGCRKGSEVDASEVAGADATQSEKTVKQIRREQAEAKRQVQQHSQQTADAAREVAAQMEKRVAELQRDPGTPASPPTEPSPATEQGDHQFSPHEVGENDLIGLLQGAGRGWVSIRDGSGFQYVIKTDGHTRVTGPGKSVDLSKLPQGSQLSVGFVFQGKDRVARDIEVIAPHRPDAH
jgi:hypothetical protein